MNTMRRTLGDRFIMEQYRKRSARKYRKAGIVFIHIPKAAGTSVCDSLYHGRVGHFTLAEMRQHQSGKSANTHSTDQSDIDGLPTFSVVRDPLARLYSSYCYARDGGGSKGSINPDPAYQSKAFRSFSAFLSEWLIEQELTSLDRVFWPQYRFVEDTRGTVDFIGKVEDMAHVQQWLRSTVSETLEIPHLNCARTQDTQPVHESDRSIVKELYREDYEAFDYA
ncbi:MAG: sulfotransferase family protein [Granulosicoccus sp.]|nr:sulfotransferase family protein [Granulosicoccus sp.]